MCERKVGNAHDTHAVAISIDNILSTYANHWRDYNSSRRSFANSSVMRPNFCSRAFLKIGKKTWQIDFNLPNSPKFFTIRYI